MASLLKDAEEKYSSVMLELKQKNDAVAKLSISANKGHAMEQDLIKAIQETGLYTFDTSKGMHNTHYHDILIADAPLHQTGVDVNGVPTYDTSNAKRCSLESKGHSRSASISAERDKFSQVRRRLMENNRAECFVFACKASIPGFLRWHFEFNKINGRYCITGYIGAEDISSTEVCMLVQMVMKLQDKLDTEVVLHQKPSDGTIAQLVENGLETLYRLREQVLRCDTMDKAVMSLRDEVKLLRESLVGTLFNCMETLNAQGFPPREDALLDVREAYESLETQRKNNCKILRNKEQFVAAQQRGLTPLKRSRNW